MPLCQGIRGKSRTFFQRIRKKDCTKLLSVLKWARYILCSHGNGMGVSQRYQAAVDGQLPRKVIGAIREGLRKKAPGVGTQTMTQTGRLLGRSEGSNSLIG